jgi:hypothetical protein
MPGQPIARNSARGYRTISLELPRAKESVAVYTSPRVADALEEITSKATLYEGVRLVQILEAVYEQGRKDGARRAFEALDKSLGQVKKQVPHKKPGRPRRH